MELCRLIPETVISSFVSLGRGLSRTSHDCSSLMWLIVMILVLQVYFRDHKESLDYPNMDTQSELMKYHSDFLIGSTFQICSLIGNISIRLPFDL
jgi:hypothetical protein